MGTFRITFRILIVGILLLCGISSAQSQWFRSKDNADELYEQAVQLTNQKNYNRAIAVAKEGLSQRPEFTDLELLLGRVYMLTGQWDLARKHVDNVLKNDEKYLDAYYYKINIEVSSKRYKSALTAVDGALKAYPNRKDLLLRKLGILDVLGYIAEGNNLADRLIRQAPRDKDIQQAYIGHHLENARRYRAQDLPSAAISSLDKVFAIDPGNLEARELMGTSDLSVHTRSTMANQISAELESNPTSYEWLMKKLNMLREDLRYAEALTVLQTIYRYHPNDGAARALERELREEAAVFYTQTDPYMLYQSILEKDPSNREALRKVIGLATSRGAYREAMTWVNAGLRREPSSTELLLLKLDLLEYERQFSEASQIAGNLLQRSPSNTDMRARYVDLKIASSRYYVSQQQNDLALRELELALEVNPQDSSVLESMVNTYAAQRNYDRALETLEQQISVTNNDHLKLKQASLLTDAGRFDEAGDVLQDLINAYPDVPQYLTAFTENRLRAGNRLLQDDEYALAAQQLRAVLRRDTNNREAINYLINLYSATNELDSALYFTDLGLAYYPQDREILLKRSSVLTSMGRFDEANREVRSLMERYPYTIRYRDAYTENLLSAANQAKRINNLDGALDNYRAVLAINPKDSVAQLNIINIQMERLAYDSAQYYIQQSLQWNPNWTDIRLRRAQTYEAQRDFLRASADADTVYTQQPSVINRDYAAYLKSRTLKNQFGMHFLRSRYDYSEDKYDIATLEYIRTFKKGTIGGRINYAGRASGTGLQAETEMYYTHNPKWYSYAHLAFGNQVAFPQVRLGYSLYRTFKNESEVGLGVRYLQRDTLRSTSVLGAYSKTIGDFWVNLRGYAVWEAQDIASSFALVGRYYMNNRQDFLSTTIGLGTSPDDRSRLIQFSQLTGLLTRSVGAGYQRTFQYRTSLGINGTWISQKVGPQNFQNQYDLYISVMRRF